VIEINGRSVPTTIEDLLDPARTAVVVVDMQNDFCTAGGTVEAAGGSLEMFGPAIERMHALLAAARAAGVPVVHVRMLTQPGGYTDSAGWMRVRVRAARSYGGLHEGAAWEYTTPGTWGADFAPGFEPHGDEPVVDKFRSSAFFGTNLDTILRTLGVDNLVVIGCTTEGCVDSTVRDAGFRDYVAVVPEDAVASDVRVLHDAAVTIFRAYRADVVSTADILGVWA
jgi:nicotinamidase-related amidase